MIIELLTAFGFVFIAEMGDKTQILAMAFASKYNIKNVLIGILIGSFFNHALAVALGYTLNNVLPLDLLGIIAGTAFIIFGLWSLKMGDEESVETSKYGPILTVSLAFFIGELGDKTQLTAITLAAESAHPIFILIGTVSAMVAAGVIGIIVGLKLGSKVPEFYIKIGASVIFLTFGTIKLLNNIPKAYISPVFIVPAIVVILVTAYLLLKPTLAMRRLGLQTPFQAQAEALKKFYNKIEQKVEELCLGTEICGNCDKNTCIVSLTKQFIKGIKNDQPLKENISEKLLIKDYKKEKVLDCFKLILDFYKENKTYYENKDIKKIRENLEKILLIEQITDIKTYQEYIDYLESHYPEIHKKIV